MKFDLTTFLFQIINFIVLLFILKRLLYKPVREIMEKRRGLIEKTIEDAEETKRQALQLKEKYEEENGKLKNLRGQMLESVEKEVADERKKLLARAEEEAEKIREKEMAVLDAEKRSLHAELEVQAVDIACVFATRILQDLSDEELHKSTYRRLYKALDQVVPDLTQIRGKEDSLSVELVVAYPMSNEEIQRFSKTLESSLSRKIIVKAVVDNALLAGARIKAYDKVYDFSLSGQIDQLRTRLKKTI